MGEVCQGIQAQLHPDKTQGFVSVVSCSRWRRLMPSCSHPLLAATYPVRLCLGVVLGDEVEVVHPDAEALLKLLQACTAGAVEMTMLISTDYVHNACAGG